MIRLRPALLLAVATTGTAISMSVLAGWQRGGWLAERLVWVAVGVVLVTGAHLLPALCRSAPPAARCIGAVLWCGCMAAASWGHATFFLLAQSHAGEVRVSAIRVANVPAHRDLTAVMTDRAAVTAQLAEADARRCIRDCPALRVRRASLAARLDALEAESADIRRWQGIEDRDAQRRDALRSDPVAVRLALPGGVTNARLDLFTGLAFATVLEGMACLLWWIALPQQGAPPVTDRRETGPAVTTDAPVVTAAATPAVTEPEVTKLLRDIEAGIVRPTVSSIRRHLGCSQARAAALRRQVSQSS